MYKFSFFRTIHRQVAEARSAVEIAPVKLAPALAVALAGIKAPEKVDKAASNNLWVLSVSCVMPLIARSIFWNILAACALAAGVWASRHLIDQSNSFRLGLVLCGIFLVTEISRHLINYFEMLRRSQMARTLQATLLAQVNRKLTAVEPQHSGEFSTGNLKTLLGADIESIEDFVSSSAAIWIPTIVCVALFTPILYILSGWIGIWGLVLSMLQVPVAVFLSRFIERYAGQSHDIQDVLSTTLGEWLKNVRLVRYLGWQTSLRHRVAKIVRAMTIKAIKSHIFILLTYGLTFSWWMVPIVGMIGMIQYAAIPINVADFFPSLWLLSVLSNYMRIMPHSFVQFGSAKAGVARITKFLMLPEISRHIKKIDGPGQLEIPVRITFNQVSIVFEGSSRLGPISCTFDLNSKTALIGEVGSGKSLFLALLCGEIAPSSGEITLDYCNGLSIPLWSDYGYDSWRKEIAYVPQEAFLSNAIFRLNVDLNGGQSEEALMEAIEKSCLREDLKELPSGLETEVGEAGINLSGGQKQRVSIARAFISNRKIFILDDPLSAVDRRTEIKLFKHILENSRGLIIASHRLDELLVCDRLMVLDSGVIVEDGIPKELMQDSESYFSRFLRREVIKSDDSSSEEDSIEQVEGIVT